MRRPKHVYVSREAFVWSKRIFSWAALRHVMGHPKSLYWQRKYVVWATINDVLCDSGHADPALFWRVSVLGITATQPRSNLITMPDKLVKVQEFVGTTSLMALSGDCVWCMNFLK